MLYVIAFYKSLLYIVTVPLFDVPIFRRNPFYFLVIYRDCTTLWRPYLST